MVEEVVERVSAARTEPMERIAPVRLAEVSLDESPRFPTGFREFDRVLGGGIVAGSVTLVAGFSAWGLLVSETGDRSVV